MAQVSTEWFKHGEWFKQLDPEIVKLVAWGKQKAVETDVGGIRCKLVNNCLSSLLVAVEAMVAGLRPVEALRYCIVCKTNAHVVFDNFIKCVEVRGADEYMFVVSTRDGEELRVIYSNFDEAFEGLNEIIAEHHHVAIDDEYYDDFVWLVRMRSTECR